MLVTFLTGSAQIDLKPQEPNDQSLCGDESQEAQTRIASIGNLSPQTLVKFLTGNAQIDLKPQGPNDQSLWGDESQEAQTRTAY